MEYTKTTWGHGLATLTDGRGNEFTVQESSAATDYYVWVGISDPRVVAGPPWVPHILPDNALVHSRAHITREQARELAEVLLRFAETGLVESLKERQDRELKIQLDAAHAQAVSLFKAHGKARAANWAAAFGPKEDI